MRVYRRSLRSFAECRDLITSVLRRLVLGQASYTAQVRGVVKDQSGRDDPARRRSRSRTTPPASR